MDCEIIDTVSGAANRALEASVSPLDQVGLVYLTNTTTAGRARFIYCPSNCSSLDSFVPMTAGSDTIETSNITAAFKDTGIAWCKHNSTTYYPAVTYPSTQGPNTRIRYASCLGDLSTCTTATGWSGQYITVVTTAGTISKLYIDPTVTGDLPKIIARDAGNTLLQAFQINDACNVTPTGVTAGNTFGAATSGTAWASLLKSSSGLFHVVTNLGTTNVHYHNSVTSTFSTTTWNTAGVIDTITLPAAGSGASGADINNTDSQIYVAYGGAAAPFSLSLGVVADASLASNVATSYVLQPDTTGGIQLEGTGQTRNIASAAISDGRLAVAYIDNSIGSPTGALLKYGFRNGTSASTAWASYTIPNTSTPMFPSLAFDHNNKPWISYYDGGAGQFRYYLVTNTSTNGTGDWISYQFPINSKTATAVAPATDDTAVAMFYSGGVAKPVLIVLNSTAAGGTGVRAAMLDTSISTFVGLSTIDSLGASFGTRLAAAFDRNGNIGIAYYDLTATKVKFNFTTNGLSWFGTSTQISATGVGREGLAIQINPSNSQAAVSYYDRANNSLFYTSCSTSITSCFTGANWSTSTLNTSLGISGIAATTNEQLLNTSLTFSASGVPYVAYMQGIGATTQLLGVYDKDSGSFASTTLVSSPSSAISGAAAVNFAMSGFNASSARTSLGTFFSAYIGPNNWLYAITCGD